MAFGIKREELNAWKQTVLNGEIAFLTHYWQDPRFPHSNTVTKVGCNDIEKLKLWGKTYGLEEHWIDFKDKYPHYDLFGSYQSNILRSEGQWDQIKRFNLIIDNIYKR